ncbi:MAG: hypothetical protein K940chlam7_01711 [Chlamydiae bacterium]|nr:hypothetical protein [Chlamydiota bacterium]
MNIVEPEAPKRLKEIQEWFARVITRPLDEDSKMNPIAPSGKTMEEEACEYILASPTLKPAERIQLYNQQYWWRLLNTLHTTFPLLTRILGYHRFNETIAVPYLVKYPSQHWSLGFLGEDLSRWMKEEYSGEEKQLLSDAIAIDWAYNFSFFAAHHPPIVKEMSSNGNDFTRVMSQQAHLQPHIFLFELDYDLFGFRDHLKQKSPDFWSSHHFPHLKHELAEGEKHFPELKREKNYYFVLYRNLTNVVVHEEISRGEFLLLECFQKGSSIEKACEWLESQDKEVRDEAAAHLQQWIQKWVINHWLTSILNSEDL